MTEIFNDQDADLSLIQGEKVAVIGLKDGWKSIAKAEGQGLNFLKIRHKIGAIVSATAITFALSAVFTPAPAQADVFLGNPDWCTHSVSRAAGLVGYTQVMYKGASTIRGRHVHTIDVQYVTYFNPKTGGGGTRSERTTRFC